MERYVNVLLEISVQAALVAVLVWALSRLLRKSPASWRYAIWLFVLIKFLVPPILHVPSSTGPQHDTDRTKNAVVRIVSQSVGLVGTVTNSSSHVPSRMPKGATPLAVVSYVWFAGVCLMTLRLGIRYRRQASFYRSTIPAEGELPSLLEECTLGFRVRRRPQIRLYAGDCPPLILGIARPAIVLPARITETCSHSDIAAILMHELAHVRRYDNAGRWLIEVAQVLFFFHPAIWLAAREMRRECELACDELVLSEAGMGRGEYASGYVSALKLANAPNRGVAVLAMAEPFDIEKRRLNMILNNAVPKVSKFRLGALLLLMTLALPSFALKAADSASKSVAPKVLIQLDQLVVPAGSVSEDDLRKLGLDWKQMNDSLSLESQTKVVLPQRTGPPGPPLPESLKPKMMVKPTVALLSPTALEKLPTKLVGAKIQHMFTPSPILPSNTVFPFAEASSTVANGVVTTEYDHFFIRPRVNAKADSVSLAVEIKSPTSGKSGVNLKVRSGDSVLIHNRGVIRIVTLETAK